MCSFNLRSNIVISRQHFLPLQIYGQEYVLLLLYYTNQPPHIHHQLHRCSTNCSNVAAGEEAKEERVHNFAHKVCASIFPTRTHRARYLARDKHTPKGTRIRRQRLPTTLLCMCKHTHIYMYLRICDYLLTPNFLDVFDYVCAERTHPINFYTSHEICITVNWTRSEELSADCFSVFLLLFLSRSWRTLNGYNFDCMCVCVCVRLASRNAKPGRIT